MKKFQIGNNIFDVDERDIEFFKQKYPNAKPVTESQEEDTAIERRFGKNVATDFLGDIYRAGSQGIAQGASVEESFDLFKGKDATDEEIQAFINADIRIKQAGVSDEMLEYEKIKNEAGGGVYGFFKAMAETRGQILPQVIVSSAASMVRSAFDSEESAAAMVGGATAGSFIPVFGTLGGAIGGISGSLETATTFAQLLKEELGNKEFNKQNIRDLLQDEKKLEQIKYRSLARGTAIGVVEGLTAGLSRSVAKTMVAGGKSVRRTAAVTTGIEAIGGATGEAAGQVAAGQDFDIADILLEGAAESKGVVNVSDILTKKTYTVNDKPTSRKEISNLLKSANNGTILPEDFHKINIKVTGDNNLDNAIKEKQADAYSETQIDSGVTEISDRKKLVELNREYRIAEANTKKKGIFKVLNADKKLEAVEQRINDIMGKYTAVDRRGSVERSVGKVKEQARVDRQDVLLSNTKQFAKIGSEQLGFDPFQSFSNNKDFVKAYVERVMAGEDLSSMSQKQIEVRANELANEASDADAVNVVRAADGTQAIMINEEAAAEYGALQAGSHEILHGVMRGALAQMDKAQRKVLISEFKNQIKSNLGQNVIDTINLRLLANYKNEIAADKDFLDTTDEWFTMLSDIIESKENNITYENNKSFFNNIKNKVAGIFNSQTPYKKLSITTGEDAFNFMKEYSKNVKEGKLSDAMVAFSKGQEVDIVEDESVFSKSASDEVQNIYKEKGVSGAFDIIKQFKPIVSRIAEKRRQAPNFDKELLMSEIEIGPRGILDLIRDYKPDSGVPLAAYINKFLPARAIEASRRVLGEEFTQDVTEAKGVAAEEVADVDVKAKPKKKKIVLSERFGIDKKVDKAIAKIFSNLDISKLDFKTLKNKVPGIVGELFGISPKKLISLANITKKELQAAQMFINKNADLLIAMLPEGATPSGTATGVPKTLLNAFYTKTERAKAAKTGSKAGLAIQQKNNIDKKDFLETFGIIDGKPDRTDRNTSARVLALANLTGKMVTNQAIRIELAKSKANTESINKIKEGKSSSMFSKSAKSFNIKGTIDNVLDTHNKKVGRKTFKLKTEEDVDLYIEAMINDTLPLMPRQFWFGTPNKDGVFGSEFTPSNRAVDNKDIYRYYQAQILALNTFLPDEAFGKDIDGVNDYSRPAYKSLFEGKKGVQVDKIKSTNKRTAKIHEALWSRIYEAVQKDPTRAAAISNYFKLVSKQNNHWHRAAAEIIGYSKKPKGTDKKIYEYEHAMPATASYMYLMDGALNGYDFNTVYKPVMDNFKLIALDAAENKKLNNAGLGSSMPEGWNTVDNKWWERYFNNLVDIDPNSIVTLNGKTFKEELGVPEFTPDLNSRKSFSKSINSARKNKKPKGITILDFDDTLATTKSLVKFTTPEGKTVTLNAEQFASTYEDLLDLGYVFDFSDFNKVVKGKLAPLFNKAIKLQGKFGPENMFVLTARPPQAQKAIFDFLKANGLNIPLKNITGLGNSTSEAKALWVANKVGEGYNDFYFADDALQNVQAVKNMLDQFDVKSKIQQAKVKFSKSMDKDFNDIIEDITGIESVKRFDFIKARKRGASKGKFRLFIPPSHEDFVGLLYNFMGKGRKGDAHREFLEQALVRPLNRANKEYDTARQSIATDYKNLNKQFPNVKDKLIKKTPDGDFIYQDAIRVYLWDKHGYSIPGLSPVDQKNLVDLVKSDNRLESYAKAVNVISKQETYVDPTDGWDSGDIRMDLDDATGRIGRAQFFEEFNENADIIFSKENLNKIEAGYGKSVREALEDILYRIKTGRNKPTGQSGMVNSLMNWLNGSVGSVMFFNMRSALLQQMSLVNYINFADNNVFAAAKAFANQPQYWSDWSFIFNSDMLKQRRGGIMTDVNGAELAAEMRKSKSPHRFLISKLLELGFLPTQIGDNIAIATGGATYYRNRINTYLKQGLSKKEAEAKAFTDFQDITQSTQQSARPDMVSQQQASIIGKVILNFQNVTSQFNRLGKKAFQDIYNRRITKPNSTQMQSDISNAARITYYFAVQNAIFYTLQTALFAMMFDDDEEDVNNLFLKKQERLINGSIDSVLRGSGIFGGVIATLKNVAIAFARQRDVNYNPDESAVIVEALNFSPVLGIKARKIVNAEKTLNYNKKVIKEMETFDIDNPQWSAVTNYIEGFTNAPLNRLYNKTQNVRQGLNNEHTSWERTLMFLGWSQYNLNLENTKIEEVKEEIKKKKEVEKKKEKEKQKQITKTTSRKIKRKVTKRTPKRR